MIKNAMRIGRLLALSSLLSIAVAAPNAAIEAGAAALADAAASDGDASWVASADGYVAAQTSASPGAVANA